MLDHHRSAPGAALWALADGAAGMLRRWRLAAALAQVDQHVLCDIGLASDPEAQRGEILFRRLRLAANGASAARL